MLLRKLYKTVVGRIISDIPFDHLEGRKQFVWLEKLCWEELLMSSCVSHGSLRLPLLFCTFVKDLYQMKKVIEPDIFAVDLKSIHKATSTSMFHVTNWNLKIGSLKCAQLIFKGKSESKNLHDKPLRTDTTMRDLIFVVSISLCRLNHIKERLCKSWQITMLSRCNVAYHVKQSSNWACTCS